MPALVGSRYRLLKAGGTVPLAQCLIINAPFNALGMQKIRTAMIDDYQNVTLSLVDWSRVSGDVEIEVFQDHLDDEGAVSRRLKDFDIVCMMRERTRFPRSLIERLPNLKLLMTSGMRNPSIDHNAAKKRGVTV